MNTQRSRGFTLIELMITVAVVAILAAVAYPAYNKQITRASREAAKSELLQLASLQEKIYLNSSSYAVSISAAYNGRSDGGLGVAIVAPATLPRTSDKKYDLTISPTSGSTQSYTITATPVAGNTQTGDGNLTIASDGSRTWGSTTW